MSDKILKVRKLGVQDYETVWHAMSAFTDGRDQSVTDEIWLVQHPPVFTQGQAGKAEHLLMPGDIPVVKVDRGGQVTYHGPGQLVAYPLVNLRRHSIGVRDLVTLTENAIVDALAHVAIKAFPKADAPGVYVDTANAGVAKVASLGFRIRKGCSFHGLSLNVNMDMSPYGRINPCGYQGLQMVQTSELSQSKSAQTVAAMEAIIVEKFAQQLGYSEVKLVDNPTSIFLLAS